MSLIRASLEKQLKRSHVLGFNVLYNDVIKFSLAFFFEEKIFSFLQFSFFGLFQKSGKQKFIFSFYILLLFHIFYRSGCLCIDHGVQLLCIAFYLPVLLFHFLLDFLCNIPLIFPKCEIKNDEIVF